MNVVRIVLRKSIAMKLMLGKSQSDAGYREKIPRVLYVLNFKSKSINLSDALPRSFQKLTRSKLYWWSNSWCILVLGEQVNKKNVGRFVLWDVGSTAVLTATTRRKEFNIPKKLPRVWLGLWSCCMLRNDYYLPDSSRDLDGWLLDNIFQHSWAKTKTEDNNVTTLQILFLPIKLPGRSRQLNRHWIFQNKRDKHFKLRPTAEEWRLASRYFSTAMDNARRQPWLVERVQ
jgi:hypothetical protein